MFTVRSIFTAACVCVLMAMTPGRASDTALVFESDIRPLLVQKCEKCHSDRVRKGGLSLSDMNGLRRGGESGEPVIAETVDESLLWIMLDSGAMPPEGQPKLTNAELTRIREWISAGAPSTTPPADDEHVITQHDVLPIVLLRCTACHGARVRQGGVDLRTAASMKTRGDHGPALIPGDADASLMIQRIESEACPPRELLLKFFVRRPPADEVQILRDWIDAGAPVIEAEPDVADGRSDPLVTDDDRTHWAFQRPQQSNGPHSIDEFIQVKLNSHGLTFSPEADRDVLIRRAFLDLTGLPPDPVEWRHWHDSDSATWYEEMIDRLLASPHYGERWGRYWLDIAGYADSEGGVSNDPLREVAWKYRDYVISAFNSDKPWDRFLLEQIAGDELLDYQAAAEVTDDMVRNLIATGFLRMSVDQTGSRTMNFVPERLGVIADTIGILGSGVMGLTLECARCHSHKYDPIPQRDYYRFKAIFQGALDEHDWLSFRNRYLELDTAERRRRVAATNPPRATRTRELQAARKKAVAALQLELLRQHDPDQPESDRMATLEALRIPDNTRTLRQRLLVEKLQRAELADDTDQSDSVHAARQTVDQIDSELADIRRQMEPSLKIRALWDRGDPSPTYLLRRGEHDKPGPLVGPGVPSVLTDGQTPFDVIPPFPNGTPSTGRRLAFARWLTRPDHPLTARVLVNRVWHRHFGAGIVRSLENFGRKGDHPSHPRLLDWLAVQFVEQGWSMKTLHRMMMTSRTYRQSSVVTAQALQLDPSNRLLSRMSLRRMDAEALRDSLLFVADRLDPKSGGPPDEVVVDQDGLVSAVATPDHRWRRSIYLQHRRTQIPSLLATFDYPEMGPNCVRRSVSTVSPQALMLKNNHQVRLLAESFAARVAASLGDQFVDLNQQVEAVYHVALSRSPDAAERQAAVDSLRLLQRGWQGNQLAALETFCHTILNSAAFLYID